ncbi:uncharacterized protein LOC129608672 [Condylostylus longicornis]|uniref:uncharacterized protein LOC129608672 n=1 Tax=Condylostylus longicornis TaxID=2530218 RepID=UPI00244E4572|nr:uncharacterized protein LOC129608672 [Condylostylus longicornis]
MKLSIYLIVLAVIINTAYSLYTHGHNGRPNCITRIELEQRNWRNNFDPTRYWICSKERVPATEAKCPDQQFFIGTKNKCVPISEWVWTPPVDPPSLA